MPVGSREVGGLGPGRRIRVCLATDSPEPSGVGEQMLLLATELSGVVDAGVAARPETGLTGRAARVGLRVTALDPGDPAAFVCRLQQLRTEILHVHAGIGWEGHELARLGREAGVPVVLRTEHLPYLLTDPDQRRDHAAGCALVDRVICVSESAAESFRDAGIDAARIVTIRNGIRALPATQSRREMRRNLGIEDDAPVLLTVARFTEQKGHRVLLDAVPDLLAIHPGLRALLVGTGPLANEIAAMVRDRGHADTVRLLGRRGDVADLMAAADMLVLASFFEGLPLVVLEAMAAGLPVVATRVGGTLEAVEDGVTGWLVPAGDGPALAGAIARALADRASLRRAGEAGRRRFDQRFQASRMAEETFRVYNAHAGDRMRSARGE
jgi:glycosyltransferase involved in cell wall biosynthesis